MHRHLSIAKCILQCFVICWVHSKWSSLYTTDAFAIYGVSDSTKVWAKTDPCFPKWQYLPLMIKSEQTDRQTERQTYRQANGQKGKWTHICTKWKNGLIKNMLGKQIRSHKSACMNGLQIEEFLWNSHLDAFWYLRQFKASSLWEYG